MKFHDLLDIISNTSDEAYQEDWDSLLEKYGRHIKAWIDDSIVRAGNSNKPICVLSTEQLSIILCLFVAKYDAYNILHESYKEGVRLFQDYILDCFKSEYLGFSFELHGFMFLAVDKHSFKGRYYKWRLRGMNCTSFSSTKLVFDAD